MIWILLMAGVLTCLWTKRWFRTLWWIILATACALALVGSAQARPPIDPWTDRIEPGTKSFGDEIRNFAKLSWSEKVDVIKKSGGRSYRDCTGIMNGEQGVTQCFHVDDLDFGDTFVLMRTTLNNSTHQWCYGVQSKGVMICTEESTGHLTGFVLIGGQWHIKAQQ